MILLQLFWSFLQIGLFSFGGGYAAMPLIQTQIVTQHGWLGMAEFTDLVTISQMTPGPIAINAATFVGLRVAGLSGALAATVGCMLPSCVLVTLLARLYLRYRKLSLLQGVLTSLRPAVVAMIASAGVSILVTAFWDEAVTFAGTNWRLVVIFASSLLLLRRTKLSPHPRHATRRRSKPAAGADPIPVLGKIRPAGAKAPAGRFVSSPPTVSAFVQLPQKKRMHPRRVHAQKGTRMLISFSASARGRRRRRPG